MPLYPDVDVDKIVSLSLESMNRSSLRENLKYMYYVFTILILSIYCTGVFMKKMNLIPDNYCSW